MTSPAVNVKGGSFPTGGAPGAHYDLAVFMAGLSSRAAAVGAESSITSETSVVFEFVEEREHPLRESVRQELLRHADSCSEISKHVVASRRQYREGVAELLAAVSQSLPQGRAAKVFIDLTAMPRYYAANLIAQLFLSGRASCYCLYYAEGNYVELPRRKRIGKRLTHEWSLLPVPGLSEPQDPTKPRGFVLAVGFEANKTNRLISRHAPERVWLLEPRPGFNSEYTKRSDETAHQILEFAGDAAAQYLLGTTRAAAGDVAGAHSALQEALPLLESLGDYSWTFVPAGTRPHCAAMTLFCLQHPEISLVCPTPGEYIAADVQADGTSWMCTVVDNTVSG